MTEPTPALLTCARGHTYPASGICSECARHLAAELDTRRREETERIYRSAPEWTAIHAALLGLLSVLIPAAVIAQLWKLFRP